MQRVVVLKNGKFEAVFVTNANKIQDKVGLLIGKYEPGDDEFLKQDGNNFVVCPKLKSEWLKKQFKK